MNALQQLTHEWWTVSQAGWVGGVVGVLGSLFGTVLGSLSFLVQRGKAKGFMLGGYALMAAIGIASLVAGIIAAVTKQPWHVLQPLLIAGFLFTFLGLMLGTVVRKQYRLAEERKLDAAQIRGG
jgi:MFS family permease